MVAPAAAFRATFAANTIAAGTYRATGANTSTTLVLTTTVDAPAGSLVVVSGAANNASASTPTFRVSDSASNTYTTQLQGCGGPGAAALDGVCGFVATTRVSAQLAIGATITITLSAANTRIAANAQFFQGVAEAFRSTATSATSNTTTTTPSLVSGAVNAGDIVVGFAMVEDGSNTLTVDSDTLNGSWSTNSLAATSNGAGTTEVMANTQYKEVSAAGAQTYNLTTTSADNWMAVLVLNRMATPEAATNLSATPQNTQVALSWTAAASNDSPITDYVIEYKTSASPTWLVFADGTSPATTATVTGLVNGTSYDFRVTGVNAIGTSDVVAPTATATPRTVPGAPTGVSASATASTKSMQISWTAPASNGGASITGYTVIDGTDATICSSATTSCTVSNLSSGSSYTFRVYATNVAGNGANSTASASTLQTSIPNAPGDLRLISARYRFLIDWSAPADNGFAVSSYTATASNGTTTRTCTVSAPATRCTITGFPSAQSVYTVSVRATNVYGAGPASATVAAPTWFTPQKPQQTDLRTMDLSGLDLSNVNLTGADLTGVSFAGSNLSGAFLIGATITNANFSGATLTGLVSSQNVGTPAALPTGFLFRSGSIVGPGVNLSFQNLSGADLSGLSLSNLNFSNANLSGANLAGSTFLNGNFSNANLSGANFSGTNLTGANLSGANLSEAALSSATLTRVRSGNVSGTPASLPQKSRVVSGFIVSPRTLLIGANLSGTDLSGLDFTGINMQNANFTGANFSGVVAGPGTSFVSATLTNANFSNAALTAVSFAGVSMGGANLTSTTFTGGNFLNANLSGATLSGTSLVNANFTGTNFSNASVSSANFTGALLSGATLTNVSLANSNLTRLRSQNIVGTPTLPTGGAMIHGYIVSPNVNLSGANLVSHDLSSLDLTGVLLVGANLHGAKLDNTNLTRTNFKDAAINGGTTLVGTTGRPAVLPNGHVWRNNQLTKV